MLSIEDIYREVGKNIFICPLNTDNFRDNSIDLTASEFAWTSDGVNIFNEEKGMIQVPPYKTACILTKEAIYVSERIGGTYHSRVSLTKKGFGHIGTMLDPKYCGQSLIMLHNTTDHNLELKEGERLVSLAFYYLETPIGEEIRSTPPSHSNKIAEMDSSGRYTAWCNNHQWANNPVLLRAHFTEYYAKEFRERRNLLSQRKNILKRVWASAWGRIFIKYLIVSLVLLSALFVISSFFAPADKAGWAAIIVAVVTSLAGIIAGDISRK